MRQFYTYLHCRPNGFPFYVGKGVGRRAFDLKSNRNKHHNNVVNKYGKENIQIFVFPCESEEQAFNDEIQQIAQLRKEGYELCNLTDGGEGVSGLIVSEETRNRLRIAATNPSPETRTKLSIARRKRVTSEETRIKMSNTMKGKKITLTDEHKEILRKYSTGRKINETTRQKMKDAKIGRIASEETKRKMSSSRIGKCHSDEAKAKMRLAKLGKKRSPETIEKMRIANTGKKHSEETKIKCSIASKNRIITDETRLKLSKARTGFKFSEETKLKMSKTRTGKPQSEETKKKRSEAMKIYWANKK